MALLVKNTSANAEDVGDMGSIPGVERSPGGGKRNPLQYLFLPREALGQRSLAGYSPGGHKVLDITELT